MLTEECKDYLKEKLHVKGYSDVNLEEVQITEGKSGAEVYRIFCNSEINRITGYYIVKIIGADSQNDTIGNTEVEKSKQILNDAPEFRAHLVECSPDAPPVKINNQWVVIYNYSSPSIINTAPLSKLVGDAKEKSTEIISYELLSGLNRRDCELVGQTTAIEFLKRLLSYRIEPNGNFILRSKKILLNSERPSIVFNGLVFPNPLYYIINNTTWLNQCSSRFFTGKVHGDLHSQNILVTGRDNNIEEPEIKIIDYDSYYKDGYLFFDNAYLELSLYLDTLQDADLKQWINTISPALMERLDYSFSGNGNTVEKIRNSICSGIKRWYKTENYEGAVDIITVQFVLARIAAGINYFSKSAITDLYLQKHLMMYISINVRNLMDILNFKWDDENAGRFKDETRSNDIMDKLWESCGKFSASFIKIIVTDDYYENHQYKPLQYIANTEWTMIYDIGSKLAPYDLYSNLVLSLNKNRKVKYYSDDSIRDVSCSECLWINAKKNITPQETNGQHWQKKHKQLKNVLRLISSSSSLTPFLFIFDCQLDDSFMNRILQFIIEEEDLIPERSRLVFLSHAPSSDDQKTLSQKYIVQNFSHADLRDIANTIQLYIFASPTDNNTIYLPSKDKSEGLISYKDKLFYETSVEIVYSGMEGSETINDFGEHFFRGSEISWLDLANRVDLQVIEKYEYYKELILKKLSETSSRVQVFKLLHAAGSGGTTLSKRLLWDIKNLFPCIRIKKYTSDTANIINEIYRKTSQCVFAVFESGSSIMSDDEFSLLCNNIYSENCKALFLKVERRFSETPQLSRADSDDEKGLIEIKDTLLPDLARAFLTAYSRLTKDERRHNILTRITTSRENDLWSEQRTPFFYAFYTYQDAFMGLTDYIQKTIYKLDLPMKQLLSDLSLITISSQNLCITSAEMAKRLGVVSAVNIYLTDGIIPSACQKLMIVTKHGWRICHVLIAQKLLEGIYNCKNYEDALFDATQGLINRAYLLYQHVDNGYIEDFFRELLIDRAYIDGIKTKFSPLIQKIPKTSMREKLFLSLIEYYPENAHFLNHLGRLYTSSDPYRFDEALVLLEKALEIAHKKGEPDVSHLTTRACILSRKITYYLDNNKYRDDGYYNTGVPSLISDIRNDYNLASELFSEARVSNFQNSYGYFPNIQMICNILSKLVLCDSSKNLQQLLDQGGEYADLYNSELPAAIMLYDEMYQNCEPDEEKNFISQAKAAIDSLKADLEQLRKMLEDTNNDTLGGIDKIRRMYIMAMFEKHDYNWTTFKLEELRLAESNMRKTILQSSLKTIKQMDITIWYESYKLLPAFSIDTAITMLNDYMQDGLVKSFLLYMLLFLKYERGLIGLDQLQKRMKESNGYANNIMSLNSSSPREFYTTKAYGNPIVKRHNLLRDENHAFVGLRTFTGTITKIIGTKSGTVLLDNINIEATLTPTFIDEKHQTRSLTSEDEGKTVNFNLAFAYSGLRAWNVMVVKNPNEGNK